MKTIYQLKRESGVPINAQIQIPDDWELAGYAPQETNRFEFQPKFRKGGDEATESDLLRRGLAYFFVPIGPHKRETFTLVTN